MEKRKRGLFITFEGADGCGKSTQVELLYNYLKNKNIDTITTIEPGGCEIGKSLRKILLNYEGYVSENAELFMYLADRAQHTKEIILKSLEEGMIVLCDRYTDSTVAYQGYARNGDIEKINFLNNLATDNLEPDLTILLDVDSEIAQTRVGKIKDRMEKEGLEFHKKVRFGYLDLAKKYSKRYKIIDANATIEDVFEKIKEIVNGIL